jgi:hypothetical protein
MHEHLTLTLTLQHFLLLGIDSKNSNTSCRVETHTHNLWRLRLGGFKHNDVDYVL